MSAPSLVRVNGDPQVFTAMQKPEEKRGEVIGRKVTLEQAKLPAHTKVLAKVYQLNVNPEWKDFVDLSVDNLTQIIEDLNALHQAFGEEIGGYKVRFVVLARQQRTIQVLFETFGARKAGDTLKMPKMPEKQEECAFCQMDKDMPGYEEAKTDTSHVIQSKEGNPLSIANQHFTHFFAMGLTEQRDLLSTTIKVAKINMDRTGEFSRYEIIFHSGIEGGQTYGHVHGHVLAALGRKEKEVKQTEKSEPMR